MGNYESTQSDSFVHNIYIERRLERAVFPGFSEENHRTYENACLQFKFVERTRDSVLQSKISLLAFEENKDVYVAVGTRIATCLRTIKDGGGGGGDAMNRFLDSANYVWPFHDSNRYLSACKGSKSFTYVPLRGCIFLVGAGLWLLNKMGKMGIFRKNYRVNKQVRYLE